MSDNPNKLVELKGDEKALLVERRATCPFIGSAVAQGELSVRNNTKDPLASIEDVRKLDKSVPNGMFSLEFPCSQDSHPGHSGILQGDPEIPGSGRLSEMEFARLTSRAKDGWIKRSDVGCFIAENLLKDPRSKVFGKNTAALLASDFVEFIETAGSALMSKLFGSDDDVRTTHQDTEEKLTKLLGEDNLVGSAGEFGLLFAFLANKPGTKEVEGEPAVTVQDLKAMFLDKHLPEGWETWKKSRIDWVRNTTGLLISAGKEYRALKHKQT